VTDAGWYYADGDAPNTVRYWDGTTWIGEAVPAAQPDPVAVAPRPVLPDEMIQHAAVPITGAVTTTGYEHYSPLAPGDPVVIPDTNHWSLTPDGSRMPFAPGDPVVIPDPATEPKIPVRDWRDASTTKGYEIYEPPTAAATMTVGHDIKPTIEMLPGGNDVETTSRWGGLQLLSFVLSFLKSIPVIILMMGIDTLLFDETLEGTSDLEDLAAVQDVARFAFLVLGGLAAVLAAQVVVAMLKRPLLLVLLAGMLAALDILVLSQVASVVGWVSFAIITVVTICQGWLVFRALINYVETK